MAGAAAIIAAGAIASGAISSSGSKKGNQGQEMLAEIAQELFKETGPLRQETLQQALGALVGGETSKTGGILGQLQGSVIQQEGAKEKQKASSLTASKGLTGSAFEIANQEDIDRAIADLVATARTSDVAALTNLGRQIGFGQVPSQAINAASTLADTQTQQSLAASRSASGAGSSAGNLLSLLLRNQTNKATTANPGAVQPYYSTTDLPPSAYTNTPGEQPT